LKPSRTSKRRNQEITPVSLTTTTTTRIVTDQPGTTPRDHTSISNHNDKDRHRPARDDSKRSHQHLTNDNDKEGSSPTNQVRLHEIRSISPTTRKDRRRRQGRLHKITPVSRLRQGGIVADQPGDAFTRSHQYLTNSNDKEGSSPTPGTTSRDHT
uniref:Attachment protein n=1 Tax=Steinernema glaseri TaxID=37863 RepID=A0A1I8ASW4_9BILA